ncbi:MAG TPA: hypothetical protein VE526_14830 [Solirubrobacteraceae bacterium]|jgi:hypothetical protein|nr:hypothetical protein [Solirubrobacteraceae bacterium]
MAGDLIPPPSPAGRPEPDSSEKAARAERGLWSADAPAPADPVAAAVSETAPEPPRVAAEPPFRGRFGFVLGALIGVALAAIGLGVVMAMDEPEPPPPPDTWSAWKPTATDDLGIATEVAAHVAPRYRDGGKQLVGVDASGLEVDGTALDGIALQRSSGVEFIEGDGVMYTLNGLGDLGSIPHGKPSEERMTLVRREALELALYTFHYAKDIDMVIALLPPSAAEVAKARKAEAQPKLYAMLLRPDELRDRLQVPLTATIPPRTPKVAELTPANPETQTVTALTSGNVFEVSFQQAQDAKAYLVLQQPAAP